MLIRIKNLRVKTIIGVEDWERRSQQEVLINVELQFDGSAAAASDDLGQAVDYKALKHRIIEAVEKSQFFLLEKLTDHVLGIVLQEPRAQAATVEIDKPHALRFADSVSVVASGKKGP